MMSGAASDATLPARNSGACGAREARARRWRARVVAAGFMAALMALLAPAAPPARTATLRAISGRERLLIDEGWRFQKDDAPGTTLPRASLLPWLLPTSNAFIANPAQRKARPSGRLEADLPYARRDYDDRAWRTLDLPHDWGIEGAFSATGSGARGRLPFFGVGWYRKALDIPASDAGRSIFLDVDGAMSYAAIWINGEFAGGWPY